MPEFLKLVNPDTAMEILFKHIDILNQNEWIQTEISLNRVTANPIHAFENMPSFPRSSVDGYAIRASDVFGASDSLPSYLKLTGEVVMGGKPGMALHPEECVLIHTGGMLPENSDSVVMLEDTQLFSSDLVEIHKAVSVGENTILKGEDISVGQEVISMGCLLGPSEIGGLMGLGVTAVQVVKKPKIGIISSGDEIVPPDKKPEEGQVRDINSYTLSSIVKKAGGDPFLYGIFKDNYELLFSGVKKAFNECDVVVITAGSSVSIRDLTAKVINNLGEPGVLVHGINIRPGKPTILGVCNNKIVIGLPGNPVSCLVVGMIFLTTIIQKWLGLPMNTYYPFQNAILNKNIASKTGREDWIPVLVNQDTETGEFRADPIFSKSNFIFSMVKANGLLKIPMDENGIEHGQKVKILMFKR